MVIAESPTILATEAMGTRFELVLLDACGDLGSSGLMAAGEAALEVIHETEERWSLFRSGSQLASLNRHGHERRLHLDLDDELLFQAIANVHRSSEGAFDPNVARAMEIAGHFERGELRAVLGEVAADDGIGTWIYDSESRTVGFTAPGPALDLGAVAKGHALDLALRELQEAGVTCALLHGGTSGVVAMGTPPGQDAWCVRVGQQNVALQNRALAMSRSDSQIATKGGHLLNPRKPLNAEMDSIPLGRSAAVTAPTAALADAWATALCVDPTLQLTAAEALASQAVEVLLCESNSVPSSIGTHVSSSSVSPA